MRVNDHDFCVSPGLAGSPLVVGMELLCEETAKGGRSVVVAKLGDVWADWAELKSLNAARAKLGVPLAEMNLTVSKSVTLSQPSVCLLAIFPFDSPVHHEG